MSDQKTTMLGMSAREIELAILTWRALKNIDIDYEKLAQVAGFKSASSARASFGPTKKKLLGNDAKTTTKVGAKRRAAAEEEDEEEEGDENPTPTKKPRGRPKKRVMSASKMADVPADGDTDNEGN